MKYFLFSIMSLAVKPVLAQQDRSLKADSIRNLKEVTVEGVRIRQKVDRQLIFPSKNIKEHSTDGYELLKHLNIPGILVNPVERKITSLRRGNVQVRINDMVANIQDILSLLPDEVVRVEYIDNPGVRYSEDNLDAVINYIVKRRNSGYVGGLSTMQAFTTGFNNSNAYFKYNHKQSEFSFNYDLGYRSYDKWNQSSKTSYIFPDGTTHLRNYIGFNSTMQYADNYLQSAYSLADPDKYLFNVRFNYNWMNQPFIGPIQRVIEEGRADHLIYNRISQFPKIPSIDIYYSVNLPHEQNIAANLVGTYIGTAYTYNMHEYLFNQSLEETLQEKPLNDYSYSTNGKKYSLISEAIYTKNFKKIALSGGARYTVSHTNNKYKGNVTTDAVLNSDNLYAFVQMQGKLGFLNYQLGVGANYVSISQDGNGFTKWTFRPQLVLSTGVIPNVTLRYTGRISPNIPSLASLSDVRQQSNDLEVRDGNSALTPYNNYNNSFSATWSRPLFDFQLYGLWQYSPNIIGTTIIPMKQQNGFWILSWKPENQDRYSLYYTNANLTLHPVKDILDISLWGNWNRYETRSKLFSHNFVYWRYGTSINLTLGKWSISYDWYTQDKWLSSETINGGENGSSLTINYKYKDFRAFIGCLQLGYAKGFDYTSETNSRYYHNDQHHTIRNNGNMFYFGLSYKFSHGRTYKSAQRKLSNSDNDSGIK